MTLNHRVESDAPQARRLYARLTRIRWADKERAERMTTDDALCSACSGFPIADTRS